MKKVRIILWRIFRVLPDSFNEVPYRFSFAILKLFYKMTVPSCKVGYRNSLRYSCIEPFFSDLDMTVIVDEQYRKEILKSYNTFKKFLPLLGELNLYSETEIDAAVENCNPFERDRDPLLGPSSVSSATKVEKFVFAFRMLMADWETLRDRPLTRQKKWNCHFTCLGYPLMKGYERDAVLKFILSEVEAGSETARVIRFKDGCAIDNSKHLLEDQIHPLTQTLFFNHLCYAVPSPKLSKLQKDIIAAQARWEFWAMEVIRGTVDDNQIQLHFNNMKNFLKYI